MLDFWNYKFITVGRIVNVELRHRAKFRDDRSNHCRDISILDFSRWRLPPSWFRKFQNFNGWKGQEGRSASAYQISSKIGQTVAEI